MRKKLGFTLAESVVAVGLSGLFLVLISTMLAQTLELMRTSQDELIAVTAAELLIENAKNIPFDRLDNLSQEPQPFSLIVNIPDAGSIPSIRPHPVQLDLTNSNKVFGVVDASAGSLKMDRQWNKIIGNHFDGEAFIELTRYLDPTLNVPACAVSVTVNFKSASANQSVRYPRKISRKTVIFKNGVNWQ